MKKIIAFILIMFLISNFALADKPSNSQLNTVFLTMINNSTDDAIESLDENEVITDNSNPVPEKNEDSNESSSESEVPSEEQGENNTLPNEEKEPIVTPPSENNNDKTDNVPSIKKDIPKEPEKPQSSKPVQEYNIINSLNKENAWSHKTVYLTFDDGPSSLTPKILDLLKKENIKATFFVIGTKTDGGKKIIKRIVDEGHAIGNHTYSHNYSYIYESVDNFFDDLYKNENIIYEASGKRPKIIRFPGGSNNASTKTEKGKKVMNEIMYRLQKEGYVYFDWNASSGDASSTPASVNDIINNTLTWISRNDTSIVLFHDSATKNNTLKALPTIIEKLKFLGCNFEILTTKSPQIAFVKYKNTDAVPAFAKSKDRKPSYVIKKLIRLEMNMENKFSEIKH